MKQKRSANVSQDLVEAQDEMEVVIEDKISASLKEAKKNISRISKSAPEGTEDQVREKKTDSFDQQMRDKVRKARESKESVSAANQDPSQ
jgi:hypothetical protein